jgi:uncharacterized protein YyaL (SSP411 family)
MIWLLAACGSEPDLEPPPQELPVSEILLPDELRVASAAQTEGPWQNRLVHATSPYLLQHAANPVDWYEWGPEAFAAAHERDVPIFLSIGYAACHWCHVMAHESFEDPAVAAVLNARFVNIKVDREERPDVDALYMDAVHLLSPSGGGWPASIWMTPDLVPFHAGTYFPPEPGYGRPSFTQVNDGIWEAWTQDRAGLTATSDRLRAALQARAAPPPADLPDPELGRQLLDALAQGDWDPAHKGWGRDQKFPRTPRVDALLSLSVLYDDPVAQEQARQVLGAMDRGGLHDHLGGGFHRYTVDGAWTVPHFEKMLYDNAQLLRVYAVGHSITGDPRLAQVARDTADYLIRDMRASDGAFWSSEDADMAGEEGTFYVWTPDQVGAVLAPDAAAAFVRDYQVTDRGNFEHGTTVLTRAPDVDPATHATSRLLLFGARLERIPPPTDTKQVVAWNGQTISGLAIAGRLLDEPAYIQAAADAANAVLAHQAPDGALPRTLAPGAPAGTLDDYACLAEGLLDLYEADPDPRWLIAAAHTTDALLRRFSAPEGGFYQADPSATAELLVRRQEPADGAEPSGWGRALLVMVRLQAYGAPGVDDARIEQGFQAAGEVLTRFPVAAPSAVLAWELYTRPSREVVLATPTQTEPTLPLFQAAYSTAWRPDTVIAVTWPDAEAELQGFATLARKTSSDGTRAFVCVQGTCGLPTSYLETFITQLE